jgi:hypothetical protein
MSSRSVAAVSVEIKERNLNLDRSNSTVVSQAYSVHYSTERSDSERNRWRLPGTSQFSCGSSARHATGTVVSHTVQERFLCFTSYRNPENPVRKWNTKSPFWSQDKKAFFVPSITRVHQNVSYSASAKTRRRDHEQKIKKYCVNHERT